MLKNKMVMGSVLLLSLSAMGLKPVMASEKVNAVSQQPLVAQMSDYKTTKKLIGQVVRIDGEEVTVKIEGGQTVKLKVKRSLQDEISLEVGAAIVADLVGSKEGELWLVSDLNYQTAATMTNTTGSAPGTGSGSASTRSGSSTAVTGSSTRTVTGSTTTVTGGSTTTVTGGNSSAKTETVNRSSTVQTTTTVEKKPAPVRALW